jgi:hypothetical protein
MSFGISLFILSCQSGAPVANLKEDLDKYPEYSIILQDMKEEGNFFTDYYHRYKLVYSASKVPADSLAYKTESTDWMQVSKSEFQDKYNYLGMVLAAKSPDGKVSDTAHPPGYQYVGNPQYGRWRQDSSGNSFWEFYGKWAFFSYMFSGLSRPIYRTDYDGYRRYQTNRRPYYGKNKQFGTQGKYTQQTNRSFFERRQARESARRSRFSQKFNQRSRRSAGSSVRRRSGGFGK